MVPDCRQEMMYHPNDDQDHKAEHRQVNVRETHGAIGFRKVSERHDLSADRSTHKTKE